MELNSVTIKSEEIEIDDRDFNVENICATKKIKQEPNDGKDTCVLKIIEERADMITVDVGQLHSEDERNFIANLSDIFDGFSKELPAELDPATSILHHDDKNVLIKCEMCKSKYHCLDYEEHMQMHHESKDQVARQIAACELPSYEVANQCTSDSLKRFQIDNDPIKCEQTITNYTMPAIKSEYEDHLIEKSFNMSKTVATTTDVSKLRLPSIKKPKMVNCTDDLPKITTPLIQLPIKMPVLVLKTEDEKPVIPAAEQVWAIPKDKNNNTNTQVNAMQNKVMLTNGGTQSNTLDFNKVKYFNLPAGTKVLNVNPGKMANTITVPNPNFINPNILLNTKVLHLPPNTKIVPIPSNIKIVPTATASTNSITLSNISLLSKNVNTAGVPVTNFTYKAQPIDSNQLLRENRLKCLSPDQMTMVENLPKSRKVIETLINKVRSIEETSAVPRTQSVLADQPLTEKYSRVEVETAANRINNIQKLEAHNEQTSDTPCSLFIRLREGNLALAEARKHYKDYRFAWICPFCPRQYELKYSFRGHLNKAHSLSTDKHENMVLEVRPIKLLTPKQLEQKKPESETKVLSQLENINNIENSLFSCDKCNTKFRSEKMLQDHVQGNCTRKRRYQCRECGKHYFSNSSLSCHMTIHTGAMPFKCNYCDKRFRTRGQVSVHHRVHTGERPFKCQVCSLCFTHRETLISHISRHIGMKRYKCYCCNKNFSCISGLRTHRDVRPDTCGRVKFNPRATGPRVRVVRGNVIFEEQPKDNPYLRSEDPPELMSHSEFQEQISQELYGNGNNQMESVSSISD